MTSDNHDIVTESDVEQKVLWPMLTAAAPQGLGYYPSDILTKTSIRRLEVGKGAARRLYFPDYVVMLAGLPVMVVEAKAPDDDDLDGAIEEARMYAAKINELFPAALNPCCRVVASNGKRTISSPADTNRSDHSLGREELNSASLKFEAFSKDAGRTALKRGADKLSERLAKRPYRRPVSELGGQSVRNEEIGHNTFGSRLALDFRHIFSPSTPQDRAYLVRHAYVRSRRRDRYIEPIDRLIREIVPPGMAHLTPIEDSQAPRELEAVLGRGRSLEHQIMLLIGSVGSGKSTFVDYLVNVALSKEILNQTVWLRVDMNSSPVEKGLAEDWILRQIIGQLMTSQSGVDLEELENLQKIYSVEINRLKKGALALLEPDGADYRSRLADELLRLQRDVRATAFALSRYLCSERGKLLVVVLDNSDKRDREQQLLMFEIANWTQNELRCLVVLPLRESTYDLHRNEPPLDTAQKDLVFRIEPPRFTEVLSSRIALALQEMESRATGKILTYVLPNGMKVTYPASDQGMYLTCILRSLYEHDKFLRRILTGLSGRDVRSALEIFMEFCSSGHIGEHEIFKIRQLEGRHTLPLPLIARVLLRMNRRFYSGDHSYVKNVFQCSPSDARPDHFVRLAILRFLQLNWRKKGPSGIRGYHRCGTVTQRLIVLGHDADRVRDELNYLLRARCIVAEHQRLDNISDEDLVCISAAGSVHLDMLGSTDYLAACAEDTYLSDQGAVDRICWRIGQSRGAHFSELTVFENAQEFASYLSAFASRFQFPTDAIVTDELIVDLHDLREVVDTVGHARRQKNALRERGRLFVGNLFYETTDQDVVGLFSGLGIDVVDVFVPQTPEGVSKGIAFVTLRNPAQVDEALGKVNGVLLRGRALYVELARAKESHPQE